MRFDPERYDISIQIAADHHTGIWMNQVSAKRLQGVRQAGQLPTFASKHTLLSVALISGLRNIGRKHHAELSRLLGDKKPRLLVTTVDPTFVNGLRAITGAAFKTNARLKLGRNFLGALLTQLSRFTVTFQVAAVDDRDVLVLRNWANSNIVDPKAIAHIPSALVASAMSVAI